MTAPSWFFLAVALLCLAPRARSDPGAEPDAAVPLALDLVAAGLRAGKSVPDALAIAAHAAGVAVRSELAQVAGLLRLGADPADAWRAIGPGSPCTGLARVACRSSASGARLADAFEALATRLRRDACAAAEARARRAGVLTAAPLALCFLPSFVCLGIVPAVVGLAAPALHGAP